MLRVIDSFYGIFACRIRECGYSGRATWNVVYSTNSTDDSRVDTWNVSWYWYLGNYSTVANKNKDIFTKNCTSFGCLKIFSVRKEFFCFSPSVTSFCWAWYFGCVGCYGVEHAGYDYVFTVTFPIKVGKCGVSRWPLAAFSYFWKLWIYVWAIFFSIN